MASDQADEPYIRSTPDRDSCSLYTDVVLFFFSFFSKTSASARLFFFLPHPYPLALAVSKSPAVFVFYHARSTDFEEKIEGLLTPGDMAVRMR